VLDAMAITRVLATLAQPDVDPEDTLALSWVRLLQRVLNDRELHVLNQGVKPLTLTTGLKAMAQENRLPPAVQPLMHALQACATADLVMEPSLLPVRVGSVMEATHWMEAYAPHKLQLEAFAHWQFVAEQTGKTATSLDDYLNTFDLYTQYPNLIPDTPDTSEDAVTILTGHSAKGLEYAVVCVAWTDGPGFLKSTTQTVMFEPQHAMAPGMGLILRQWQGEKTLKAELAERLWQKPRLLAEQQRLFYVAITRARHALRLFRSAQSPAWTDLDALVDEWLPYL
jgi:superfamily I DNA/RNA helicase